MRQALTIGVYNPKYICQASPSCGDDVFAKGLESEGYEVFRFDYRQPSSDINQELLRVGAGLSQTDTEIVWIGKAERITAETICKLKQMLPNAIFVKWAADMRDEPPAFDIRHCSQVDWFFGTFGGDYLKKFLLPNMKGVGSIFTFVDSQFYAPMEVDPDYVSDILWTGRKSTGDNPLRNETIEFINKKMLEQTVMFSQSQTLKINMFGHDGKTWIQDDYVKYINGARVGVSVNSYKRRLYTSDRLSNFMSCGTFLLSERIDGFENFLFEGTHLDYFDTPEEMYEKAQYYLTDSVKRNKIAAMGRDRIVNYYSSQKLVHYLLNLMKYGDKCRSWEEVYMN